MNAEQILQEAQQMQEQLVKDRRWLHAHPGTGFDIADTVQYVKAELTAMGYEPQECGKAGVVAMAGGKKPGRVFLLRGDMDALPIQEESELEFASQNGMAHACGHDFHTAMLLGAARILKDHEEELDGTVKLMFQPAEEIFEGALDMIQSGILQNPPVDAAVMMHTTTAVPIPSGTLMVMAPGVSASACDFFEIRIQGKGCHGSMPEQGVDPIVTAAHLILALQEIQTREVAMSDEVALTIGMVQAGNAANIIPDTALLKGSLRTFDEEVRAYVKQRMQEIAAGIGAVYRADVKLVFGSGCPTLKNDAVLAGDAARYGKELLGDYGALTMQEIAAMNSEGGKKRKLGGSEDFAYITQEVPALMLSIAAGTPEQGHVYPQHHPKVTFDEAALANGSAVYAYTAARWLAEHK